ncbi:PLD nuclease N-terminal domain-containing protein [Actinocrispum wychmicini]|uniref:Phospholipase D-like protein n=1 Tax=Actinocrispum wychmicini TaxID=1213861 RepID=A0A4R2JXN7_9PSEU|nr:PLD nuclease N-terminal domain-containing protein [Actinocrispum wychmicini]TCO61959.1 phospholipase D-like protein [Actinocrispum wychmicini]
MDKKRWRDLEPRQRRAIVIGGAVQATLALGAWYDLSHRPRELVNGPKAMWALVIAINFIGPIVYFRFGRHLQEPAEPGAGDE